jgi:hypothetical protein
MFNLATSVGQILISGGEGSQGPGVEPRAEDADPGLGK